MTTGFVNCAYGTHCCRLVILPSPFVWLANQAAVEYGLGQNINEVLAVQPQNLVTFVQVWYISFSFEISVGKMLTMKLAVPSSVYRLDHSHHRCESVYPAPLHWNFPGQLVYKSMLGLYDIQCSGLGMRYPPNSSHLSTDCFVLESDASRRVRQQRCSIPCNTYHHSYSRCRYCLTADTSPMEAAIANIKENSCIFVIWSRHLVSVS